MICLFSKFQRLPYNECVEESAEELAEYYEKLLRVSEELEEKRRKEGLPDLYNPDGTAKIRTEIPPENILKRVEYEEPPKGVEVETLIAVMRRLHSLTAAEMRTFLKQVHQSGQGTKKQLRARLRRYYRKEFSMYRMLREGDNMPRFGNKTARYFDFLVVSGST
ncbi:unnamed protein product [Haemonchus placei]|uniref:SAP domain-containing protein n=1 Tax=Haemonchus placei TaxID=6290 RepID=A0A0N4WAA7_HAEPC|nr:unnamed protein product [Haemonchus placei]